MSNVEDNKKPLDDIYITVIAAILFAVIGAPITYDVVEKLFSFVVNPGTIVYAGAPTYVGLAVHTVVYAVLLFLILFISKNVM